MTRVPLETSKTVIAYYFHPTIRCHTCLMIERMAAAVLQESFGPALQKGSLVWLAINFEEPGNETFVQDYLLTGSTLIVAAQGQDAPERWKKLDKVWELYGNQTAFDQYLRTEVAAYLAEREK